MRLFVLIFAVILQVAYPLSGEAREVIDRFVSKATLSQTGVLDVAEKYEANVRGHRHKPIYRIIDTQNYHEGHRHGFDVKIISVVDSNGKKEKISKKHHRDGVSVCLDKRHVGKSGRFNYTLNYQVRGVANFHENHPQLIWDVTGAHFPLAISKARFELEIPSGIKLTNADLKAWQGKVSKESTARVSVKGNKIISQVTNLRPGQQFRVEVNFPIGTVSEPGFVEKFQWLMEEWYLLAVLPLSVVLILFVIRFTKTRLTSKVPNQSEVWKAPEGLRPVEVGTLIDQSCDVSDVSVTLINLAVRGYYTVREIPATGFFALSDRDYEFKKLPPPKGDKLKEYESIFLETIFGNASTAYLSNIQGIFRQYLPGIRSSIYGSLVESKLLAKDPEKDKVLYGSIGFTLAVLGVAVLFLMGETTFLKACGLGLVISGIFVAIAPNFFPLKTEKGNKVIDSIHQFRETLQTAKDRDLEAKFKEDPFLFHKLLPYAIILGVFEKWAAACEEHETTAPDWFQFYIEGDIPDFSASRFAKDVWIATKVAGLTFTAPPPRQYSSHTVGKYGSRKEQEHEEKTFY